jgi:hypothetical protein
MKYSWRLKMWIEINEILLLNILADWWNDDILDVFGTELGIIIIVGIIILLCLGLKFTFGNSRNRYDDDVGNEYY